MHAHEDRAPSVTPFRSHSALRTAAREERCVPATFGVRVAPAHDEPRSASNNSERGPTSGRSINCGSGHLIQVVRDIGRIFSFILSQPPVALTLS